MSEKLPPQSEGSEERREAVRWLLDAMKSHANQTPDQMAALLDEPGYFPTATQGPGEPPAAAQGMGSRRIPPTPGLSAGAEQAVPAKKSAPSQPLRPRKI
ncbi:MAG TPA: hypothetical protein VN711_01550 [Candidatus Saccharimonadales bacterium]|nr:hypothetical protein [Candidatus Saccharimonadales bacterium]